MSPRWFVGIVGVILVAAGLYVSQYSPSVSTQYGSVQCGNYVHPVSDEAANRDIQNRMRYGAFRDDSLAGQCIEKLAPYRFVFYGLVGIGVLTIIGAAVVRGRKPVPA
ncbi:membrane protein [Mycobacterium phage Chaser]|nr:membrane protein [Mycobacterium phage Chaser]